MSESSCQVAIWRSVLDILLSYSISFAANIAIFY
jgi:hypothetical protein